MNKKWLIVLFAALVVGIFIASHTSLKGTPVGGFSFPAATNASSTVGVYAWSSVYAGNSSQGFVALCNSSMVTNNYLSLNFGSASTTANVPGKPFGYQLAPGGCYTMSQEQGNLFGGSVYAIASSATTTLLEIYK